MPQTPPPDPGADRQQFLEFIQTVHRGETLDEGVTKFRELLAAVSTRKKGGSLVIRIDVKPPKDLEQEDVHHVTMTVTSKLPPVSRGATVWFVQPNGLLARAPHNQAAMFDEGLRVLSGPVAQRGEDQYRAASEGS